MIEEIKTDNNCIVRAFENNPISILHEDINNKRIYYFKASDVGKVLDIVNIRTSIINFDEDEKVVRTTYSSNSGNPDTVFLTSQGVYRLLYNSKKEIAKKFRKWAGNILDDIIFNESNELKRQIENQKLLLQDKELEKKREVEMTLRDSFDKRNLVYLIKIVLNDEIIIYQTMKELYEKRGISRETLRNCIKNNRVCDKYKWSYVNDNDNKNNSKRVKETNVKTNKFIIYSSMKEIYSKLNISIYNLKTIINNKETINDCIYEFC